MHIWVLQTTTRGLGITRQRKVRSISHGAAPPVVYLTLESGEKRDIPLKTGVAQGDALGPALFCMSCVTPLGNEQIQFETHGVETAAFIDGMSMAFITQPDGDGTGNDHIPQKRITGDGGDG